MDEEENMRDKYIDSDDSSMAIDDTEQSEDEYKMEEDVEAEPVPSASTGLKRKIIDDETKPKKKLNKDLYKAPTVEELNQLRETENLFHSNFFRLQIEAVLDEVKFKEKYKLLFNSWFDRFKLAVLSLKEDEEFELADMSEISNKLNCVIPVVKTEETKGVFKFRQPSNIGIVGSYAIDCAVGPDIVIDVAVEMPEELFQKQDYQNFRYFKKRAIYLSYINSIIDDDLAESKRFIGSKMRPLLKVIPKGKLNKRVTIHIHIATQEASFKLNRFLPEKNSVRQAWFFNDTNMESDSLISTPQYNSMVLHDMTMFRANSELLKIRDYPNIRDGVILLKIWMKQRELLKGPDGFGSHLITMYVLYLLQIKKLNTFMSSYQVVRNVWNCLVQSNWHRNGIAMCESDEVQKRIEEYHKHYQCVFLDSTGYHNLAAYITNDMFYWVQREATISLKHLDNIYVNSFQSLFIRRIPFVRAFDQLMCFHDTESLEHITDLNKTIDDKFNYRINKRKQIITVIVNMLKLGLGNRIHRICVLPDKYKEWECTEEAPCHLEKIFIGLELNPEYCFNVNVIGPDANLPEATVFRNFWENRAELRRFRDGLVKEVAAFAKQGSPWAERREICKRIIFFLFTEKLKIPSKSFTYVSNQMEKFLKPAKIKIHRTVYGTGEEPTLKVLEAYNSLEKQLRFLADMPLSISGIEGCSEVFRFTEVFPPIDRTFGPVKRFFRQQRGHLLLKKIKSIPPTYIEPIDVTIQLSSSGKWPEELEALRNTKTAFHIQIAENMRKHEMIAEATNSHILILKSGYVFRLKIALQKEVALLKQQIDNDGVIKYRDTEESITLENKLFHIPKLSSALHGLYTQQPSFGPACCLAKRWFAAQLIDDFHMPRIVIELLMASMYLVPEPYTPAQTPQFAFLRFLEMLGRPSWYTDPFIINFNNIMSQEEILEIEALCTSSRASLPPLFISTPYDQTKSLLTRKAPTLMILKRVSALAKASLELFEDQYATTVLLDCKPVFRPPLSDFDCLIYLRAQFNPRRLEAIDVVVKEDDDKWKPHSKRPLDTSIPIVGFDPVQCYLKELRDAYDGFALFFHDTYGGSIIGVVVQPKALEPQEFKVSNANAKKLTGDGKVILNVPAMIQDFHKYGRRIVEKIDIQSEKLKSLLS